MDLKVHLESQSARRHTGLQPIDLNLKGIEQWLHPAFPLSNRCRPYRRSVRLNELLIQVPSASPLRRALADSLGRFFSSVRVSSIKASRRVDPGFRCANICHEGI